MGSMDNFSQIGQEILQNKRFKIIFENLEIRDFLPTFSKFHKGNFVLKIVLSLEFKMYISSEPVMLER